LSESQLYPARFRRQGRRPARPVVRSALS